MKKIFLLVGVLCAYVASHAQFPSTDSLHRYNNRYVRNSAVEAFSNLRLNTLIHGIIQWIDSARAGAGGSLGIDSIQAVSDTSFRYRKNGVFHTVEIKGVYDYRRKVDTAFAFNDSTIRFLINGDARDVLIRGKDVRKLDDAHIIIGTDTIPFGAGSVTEAVNDGIGVGVYGGKTGDTLRFKTIVSDSSVRLDTTAQLIKLWVPPDVFASVSRLSDSMLVARNLHIEVTTIGNSGPATYDPDTRTLNIPEYTPDSGQASGGMPGYINIIDYGAVLNSIEDTANNHAAIEAAKAAASDGDIIYCPGGGTLYISRPIEFYAPGVNDKRYQVQFHCKVKQTDPTQNGFVLRGNWRQSLYVYYYDGGNATTTDSATYASYTGTGILALNAYNATITVGEIVRCKYGVEIRGESSDGSQYVHVKGTAGGFGLIWANYVQVFLNRTSAGTWVNEITIEDLQLGRGTSAGNNGPIGLLLDAPGGNFTSALESNFLKNVNFEGLAVGARANDASSLHLIESRVEGPAVRYPFDLSGADQTRIQGAGPYEIDWFIDNPGGSRTEVTNANIWADIAGPQTSITSNTIGTGSKTFTIATGLTTYDVGAMAKAIADTGNIMYGTVSSYNSTTGQVVLNITSVKGSGTFSNWRIKAKHGIDRIGTGLSTLPSGPTLNGIPNQAGKVVVHGTHRPGSTSFNNTYHNEDIIQMYDIDINPTTRYGVFKVGSDTRYGAYKQQLSVITSQTSVNLPPNCGWIIFNPSAGNVTARVHAGDLITLDFEPMIVEVQNTNYTLTITSVFGTTLINSSNFTSTGLYLCSYRNGSYKVSKIDGTGSSGGGDVTSTASSSTDAQLAVFTTGNGKTIRTFAGNGLIRLSSGIVQTNAAVNVGTEVTGQLQLANLTGSGGSAGQSIRRNSSNNAWEWYTPGTGSGGGQWSDGSSSSIYYSTGSVNIGVNPTTPYAFMHFGPSSGTTKSLFEFSSSSVIPSAMRNHSIAYSAVGGYLVFKGTGPIEKMLTENVDATVTALRWNAYDIHPDYIWDGSAPDGYVLASNGVNGSQYIAAPNIYNVNGSISVNRTVSQSGHLMFNGSGEFRKYGGLLRISGSVSGTTNANATTISGNAITGSTYSGSDWVEGPLNIGSGGQITRINGDQIMVTDLSGTGTRMVVAGADGELSTQAIPSSGSSWGAATPTVAVGPSGVTGTGASISISGTNAGGRVTITTGTGTLTSGNFFTISFGTANGTSAAPRLIVFPGNANAATLDDSVRFFSGNYSANQAGLEINGGQATTSTQYIFNYIAVP